MKLKETHVNKIEEVLENLVKHNQDEQYVFNKLITIPIPKDITVNSVDSAIKTYITQPEQAGPAKELMLFGVFRVRKNEESPFGFKTKLFIIIIGKRGGIRGINYNDSVVRGKRVYKSYALDNHLLRFRNELKNILRK